MIDERNKADSLIYNLEKSMKEAGDKIKESDRASIQAAIEKVKQAASGEDVAAIKRAIGDLEQAAQAMAQVLYQQPGQGPTPSAAPESRRRRQEG